MKFQKISSQSGLIVVIIAAVFVGTLVAMFARSPEEIRVFSADGHAMVEGQGQAVTLVEVFDLGKTSSHSKIVSSVYEIAITGPQPERLFLTIKLEEGNGSDDVVIMGFDQIKTDWVAVPSVIDLANNKINAEISRLPYQKFALGTSL
ncbi:hypothetical protein ACFLZY_00360 [Patescibacteria group bacterium]